MAAWRSWFVPFVFVTACAGTQAPDPRPRPEPSPRPQPQPSQLPQPSPQPRAAGAEAEAEAKAEAQARAEAEAKAEAQAEARAANAFTLKLYARARRGRANVMISGTSVRQALGLVYLGARGDTASEMASALDLDRDPARAVRAMKDEAAAWESARGKAELVVANRAWTERTLPLRPEIVRLASEGAAATFEDVDFKGAPDAARRTVNAWVSERTASKIPELLPAGSVDKDSRVVVTNAIWFKGRWPLPFPASATKDEPFQLGGSRTVTASMMHATESHRLAEVPGAKVLELRYEGSDLAMLVVLPDEVSGLAKLEEGLSTASIDAWSKGLAKRRVAITLPKLTFRSGGALGGALQELGIRTAFTSKADFGGIAEARGGDSLSLSQVFHDTWIALDENGTEAAAATGAVMRTTSLPMGPVIDFKADHPFLFVVHDAKRGRVLFIGRVSEPRR